MGTTAGQTRAARSADGWTYMWNKNGAIGTASNYTSLVWNTSANIGSGTTGAYSASSSSYPTGGTAGGYVGLFSNGYGFPGGGTSNGWPFNNYAIAAYTIQTGEAGSVSLSNGVLTSTGLIGNGIDLRIYVNDTFIKSYTVGRGATQNFSDSLGTLIATDTVYVAVGPRNNYSGDTFTLDFDVVSVVPEPGTLALFTIGTILFALWVVKKRRRNAGLGNRERFYLITTYKTIAVP